MDATFDRLLKTRYDERMRQKFMSGKERYASNGASQEARGAGPQKVIEPTSSQSNRFDVQGND